MFTILKFMQVYTNTKNIKFKKLVGISALVL